MSLLRDLAGEVFGMFVADAGLTLAVLGLVALVALSLELAWLAPLAGGALLLGGCLAILVVSVQRAQRRRSRR